MPSPSDRALLTAALAAGARRPALVAGDRSTSFGELAQAAAAVAEALAARGLGPGHRLALISAPSADSIALLLGALERGMVVSVLSGSLGEAARRHRIDELRPHLIAASLADVCGTEQALPAPTLAPLIERWEVGPGLVMWTSGTSGAPQGAYLPLPAVLWNAARNGEALGLGPDDRTLLVLDPAYCYGLIHQVLSHLLLGAAVVVPPRPGWIPDVDAVIERHGCTTLAVVPSILQALVPAAPRLARLRLVTVGGAPAGEELLAAAQARMPDTALYVTYGLTEAGPRVCTRRWAPGAERAGNVGRPLPGVELTVSDDGELLVNTPSRSPAQVAGGRLVSRQGPIRTGDLAVIEPDGSARILGRRSRAINRGGLKIAPEELERVLCSDARVGAARVVAVPDRRFGEMPMAYVTAREVGRLPDPVRLGVLCREQMGGAWVPKRIEIVDALPAPSGPRSWKEVQP